MKQLERVLAIVAVTSAWLGGTSAWAAPLDRLLRAEVEDLAASMTDGFATLTSADAHEGGAGTALFGHVIVLFGLTSWGGGNGTSQFMAVFRHNDTSIEFPDRRRARPYRLHALVQVGEDSERLFKQVQLRGDRVILSGHRWARNDAHCCPSVTTSATYRVTPYGLSEVAR